MISASRAASLLDDRACARLWAEHWARRGFAWRAIREKLLAKGLPETAIHEAARSVGSTIEDDATRARQLTSGNLQRGRGSLRAQLIRKLAARGFDEDMIERVVDTSIPDQSDETL